MLEKYRSKVVTADKAAEAIKSGDWVDFGFGSGFPELMDAALAKRKGAVTDVKIRGGLVYRPSIAVVECDPDHESFDYYSWHLGNAERKYFSAGQIHFAPMLLRLLPQMYREYLTVDVACIPVSKPDENGCCGLGLASYAWKTIMKKARTVIFEVNEHMPTLQGVDGSHRVSLDDADLIVEGEHAPLAANKYRTPSEADIKIAEYVVNEIPNGATLSLGVGTVPFTIAEMLAKSDKEDLGCHTGTISDAFLMLYQAGKLTGRRKEINTGLAAWNLASGSAELYQWLNDRPDLFYPADVDYIHNPRNMEKLSNFISINGGVSLTSWDRKMLNLSEPASFRYGRPAGLSRRAFLSPGRAGYICINSARKDKKGQLHSNILASIPAGSTISAPRGLIKMSLPEIWRAHLTGLTLKERLYAMISVAHPAFRDELKRLMPILC